MTILRRALNAFAAVYWGCGLALLLVPRWILEDWFGQPPYPDYSYVRVSGALSLTLGLFAVTVARRDDAWWWAWAFVVATGLCATIAVLHVTLGPPPGAGTLLWWLFTGTSVALTAGLVVGLTRASSEHPIG
jgi:hypothetical protein